MPDLQRYSLNLYLCSNEVYKVTQHKATNSKSVYEGGRVLVVQAYAYTKYLGKVDLVFSESGDLLDWLGDPILLDSSVPKVR